MDTALRASGRFCESEREVVFECAREIYYKTQERLQPMRATTLRAPNDFWRERERRFRYIERASETAIVEENARTPIPPIYIYIRDKRRREIERDANTRQASERDKANHEKQKLTRTQAICRKSESERDETPKT